jgi:methylenetetrahydrofolate dehydrogenase (NADP+)/methenyltetrahydrofolate cyclohydrolase
MILLDGKCLSNQIKEEIATEISALYEKDSSHKIGLAVILVGDNLASQIYVKNKITACLHVGIKSFQYNLKESTTDDELLTLIDELNDDDNVNGILVQLPLPPHIEEEKILAKIDPLKDVDGFTPYQVGLLTIGQKSFVPCTPKGIITLLERNKIEIAGRHAVIVGRSNVVGKPLMQLLLQKDATVTICHSKTKNLSDITKSADILIVAVGKPCFIKADMLNQGVILVDVGINRVDGRLVGDADFENVKDKCAYITPVPGGVGPMTITMLLQNTVEAYYARKNR